MVIQVRCLKCNTSHRLKDDMGGKKVRCNCGAVLEIPVLTPGEPVAADPLQTPPAAATTSDPLLGAVDNPLGLGNQAPPSQANIQPMPSWGTPLPSTTNPADTSQRPRWLVPTAIAIAVLLVLGLGFLLLAPGGSASNNQSATAKNEQTPPASQSPVPSVTDQAPADPPGAGTVDPTSIGSAPQAGNVVTNSVGMKLAPVDSQGAKTMGINDSPVTARYDESPAHLVQFRGPLWVGVHEVTQAQYVDVMGSNPSHYKGDARPVDSVSWEDARMFCYKLSTLPAEMEAKRVYRLPTEAEWEYIAQVTDATPPASVDNLGALSRLAWHSGNSSAETHPVGEKAGNKAGLHDMLGNVWEWCSDWYDPSYYRGEIPEVPAGPSRGIVRVLRGGSWANGPIACNGSFRFFAGPTDADTNPRIGFRVISFPLGNVPSLPKPEDPHLSGIPVLESPGDLTTAFLHVVQSQQSLLFEKLIPSQLDLARLPTKIFAEYPDRAVAIKEAIVHYRRIPSNLSHVMGIMRVESAKQWKVNWNNTRIDDVQLRLLEGTTGLEHSHAVRVAFSSTDSDYRHVLMFNGIANLNGQWRITNRISFDALRYEYPEALPTAEFFAEQVGRPAPPREPFLDDGLGVHTYDPVATLTLPVPPGQVHARNLGFDRSGKLIAYACDIRDERDQTTINQYITGSGRLFVINVATGEVLLEGEWGLEDITAVSAEWINQEYASQQVATRFSPDGSHVGIGRDQLACWNIETGEKLSRQSTETPWWKIDNAGFVTPDPFVVPENIPSNVKSSSGEYVMNLNNKRDMVRVVKSGTKEFVDVPLPPSRISRSQPPAHGRTVRTLMFFTEDDRPLVIRNENIFDVSTKHVLSRKDLFNNEEMLRDFEIEDLSANRQRIVTRYGRTGSRYILRVWDVPAGREIFVPNENFDRVNFKLEDRHALSDNGRWLALAGQNTIKIWKIFDPLVE
ncbi:MAG: SUMF1/EgtB/PvdO family nonheme iron enzyme [Pirellulaceae bacterium]